MKEITVTVNGIDQIFPQGTTIGSVLEKNPEDNHLVTLGAVIYNHLVDPDYVLNNDCSIHTLTYRNREGFAIYRRSAR